MSAYSDAQVAEIIAERDGLQGAYTMAAKANGELREELDRFRAENARLREKIQRLTTQVQSLYPDLRQLIEDHVASLNPRRGTNL